LLLAPLVRVDDGHPAVSDDEVLDGLCIVGAVHQRVQVFDPLPGHPLQGNRRLAVMYVGTRDDGADGNAAVGDIQVKLVALPIVAVALAVALASPAALGVQFLDCLFGCLTKLLLQNVLLLGFRLRAFPGPAGFPPRDHFLLLVHGLLARLDGRGVPADMTHDAAVQIGAYQGAQRLLHESLACMGCKFPAEGGLTRYGGEPADLPQRRIAEQAVAKRGDGGNLEKLLGQG